MGPPEWTAAGPPPGLTCLTADHARLGQCTGRQEQLDELELVLRFMKKPNALLIGPAGAGKTTIVEGLVHRIVAQECHPALFYHEVYQLNIADVVAGSTLRGQFEEKLQTVLHYLHPKAILFIDEAHMLVGAGDCGGGTMDAINMLKPGMARGDFKTVLATTDNEAHHLLKDSAVTRRLSVVKVPETTAIETYAILKTVSSDLAAHHHVQIDYSLLWTLARSELHPSPDAQITLLDRACAKAAGTKGKPGWVGVVEGVGDVD